MTIEQQDQTREYFRAAATEWQSKSVNASGTYSVIEGRNRAVLDVLGAKPGIKTFLDVGCGSGQLVVAAAQRGLAATGIDFADEMIGQCEANAKAAGVKADFIGDSFFDVSFDDASQDVISALGFVEYVSPEETDEFFRRSARMLRPGGSIVVASRNRLFNVFSLNDYTRLEAEMGVLTTLIAEATILHSSPSLEAALAALRRLERIDPQPNRHPVTGIPVETRYQFTPADLIFRLRRCGLTARTLFPVHYHGLPVALKAEQLQTHREIAMLASQIGFRDHRLVPFSSTFVLEACRDA